MTDERSDSPTETPRSEPEQISPLAWLHGRCLGTAARVRGTAASVMALAVAWPVVVWWVFWVGVVKAAASTPTPGTWRDIFRFGHPDFDESFRDGFWDAAHLGDTIRWLSGVELWIFATTAALAVIIWRAAQRHKVVSYGTSLVACLPLLFGLSRSPDQMRRSFDALANQGLSHPSAVGAGVGEAAYPTWIGLYFTLALFAYMAWSQIRPQSEPAESAAGEAAGSAEDADSSNSARYAGQS